MTVSSDSADAGSGVASAEFQRRPAGGGPWTTIDTDTTAPYSTSWDTTPLTDGDYDLRVITTDQAGNTFTSATRTVTVDNSAPSAPVVTLSESSPFAYASGTEIFVNTDETGTYDVDATSSDAHSGHRQDPLPGPDRRLVEPVLRDLRLRRPRRRPDRDRVQRRRPDRVEPVHGHPGHGRAERRLRLLPGRLRRRRRPSRSRWTPARTRSPASTPPRPSSSGAPPPLSDGACDPFAGGWSTVTSPDTVASGLCAQYRYRVSDRVGNEAVYTSANVVKVDLVDPAAPVLTLDESSPYAYVVGTEIFVNTNQRGTYDVEAATSDAVSGIAKVAFPGGVDDTSAPYAATYDFDDLLGTQTVTAHDRAGNTASLRLRRHRGRLRAVHDRRHRPRSARPGRPPRSPSP